MKLTPLRQTLQGGDRRSIGKANQVAKQMLRQPSRMEELIACLWSDAPVVSMRAADAAEKVSVVRPDLLKPFKAELLGLADETRQAELRWHLALMLPRLPLNASERVRATAIFREYLDDRSSIVKTCAIQGLIELGKGNANQEREMIELLEVASRTGTPAMKARCRKLLEQFEKESRQKGAVPVIDGATRRVRKPHSAK